MKLKRYKDFKLVIENYNEDYDDNYFNIEYETQNGSILIEDQNDGHYPSNHNKPVIFGKNDIDDPNAGELVPKLADNFPTGIEAEEINLISLKYFPSKEVDGKLSIRDNFLTNLAYCPQIINGDLVADNNKITSLQGCPKEVNGFIELSDNNIKTLEHIEDLTCDELYLDNNKNLENTKGLSKVTTEKLYLNHCKKLTEIIELPYSLEYLEINYTNIKSLKSLHDNKLSCDWIDSNIISEFEKEFFYDYMDKDFDKPYEQKILNHIINLIENIYDEHEDFDLLSTLNDLHLDFSKCDIPEKYSNFFKSSKSINKFNL